MSQEEFCSERSSVFTRLDYCQSTENVDNWQKEIDTMDWESPALCRAFPGTVIETETVFVECSGR